MATNRITYTLDFRANFKDVQGQLTNLRKDLDSIATMTMQPGNNLSKEFELASQAALRLKGYMSTALDPRTGKLDLSRLNTQIKMSGDSAKNLAQNLLMAGPNGAKAFMQISNAIINAQKPAMRFGSIIRSLGVTLANTMKWQLSSTALNAMTSALSNSVRYAKDLDKSLNQIRIVTGESRAEMQRFAKIANETAKTLSTNTKAVTDATLIYRQQGDSMAEAQKKAEITIKAANAAGISAQEMSEQLTGLWNSYQVGSANLELFADKLLKVGAVTATSAEELSSAMTKVAATANAVGVSVDQMMSTIATVSSATRISAEQIGTAFKTIYARMGDLQLKGFIDEDGVTTSLGSVSTALKQVGINVLNSNGSLRDMGMVVEELGNKWTLLSRNEQTAIAEAVAGKRQYTQLFALFENWDQYQSTLRSAAEAQGELNKQQAIYADSVAGAEARLKAAKEDLIMEFIDPKTVQNTTDAFATIIQSVDGLIESAGGIMPIFMALGGYMMTKFAPQISSGITNMVTGVVASIPGLGQKAAQDFLNKWNGVMETAKQNPMFDNPVDKASLDVMKEMIVLKKDIENSERAIGLRKKETLNIMMEELKATQANNDKQKENYHNLTTDRIAAMNTARSSFSSETARTSFSKDSFNVSEISSAINQLDSSGKIAKKLFQGIEGTTASSRQLAQNFQSMGDKSKEIVSLGLATYLNKGVLATDKMVNNVENMFTVTEAQRASEQELLDLKKQEHQNIAQIQSVRTGELHVYDEQKNAIVSASAAIKDWEANGQKLLAQEKQLSAELIEQEKLGQTDTNKYKQTEAALESVRAKIEEVTLGNRELIESETGISVKAIEKFNQEKKAITDTIAKLKELKKAQDNTAQDTSRGKLYSNVSTKAEKKDVASKYAKEVKGMMDSGASNQEIVSSEAFEKLKQSKKITADLRASIIQFTEDAKKSADAVDQVGKELRELGQDGVSLKNIDQTIDDLQKKADNLEFKPEVKEPEPIKPPSTEEWIQSITSVSGAATGLSMSVSMAFNSLNTMLHPDTSGIERVTATFMLLGSTINTLKGFNDLWNTSRTLSGQIAAWSSAEEVGGFKKVIAALFKKKAATEAATAADQAAKASNPVGWVMLAVTALMTLVPWIYKTAEAYSKAAKEERKHEQALKDLEKVQDNISKKESEISIYDDLQQKLHDAYESGQNLAEVTRELNEALGTEFNIIGNGTQDYELANALLNEQINLKERELEIEKEKEKLYRNAASFTVTGTSSGKGWFTTANKQSYADVRAIVSQYLGNQKYYDKLMEEGDTVILDNASGNSEEYTADLLNEMIAALREQEAAQYEANKELSNAYGGLGSLFEDLFVKGDYTQQEIVKVMSALEENQAEFASAKTIGDTEKLEDISNKIKDSLPSDLQSFWSQKNSELVEAIKTTKDIADGKELTNSDIAAGLKDFRTLTDKSRGLIKEFADNGSLDTQTIFDFTDGLSEVLGEDVAKSIRDSLLDPNLTSAGLGDILGNITIDLITDSNVIKEALQEENIDLIADILYEEGIANARDLAQELSNDYQISKKITEEAQAYGRELENADGEIYSVVNEAKKLSIETGMSQEQAEGLVLQFGILSRQDISPDIKLQALEEYLRTAEDLAPAFRDAYNAATMLNNISWKDIPNNIKIALEGLGIEKTENGFMFEGKSYANEKELGVGIASLKVNTQSQINKNNELLMQSVTGPEADKLLQERNEAINEANQEYNEAVAEATEERTEALAEASKQYAEAMRSAAEALEEAREQYIEAMEEFRKKEALEKLQEAIMELDESLKQLQDQLDTLDFAEEFLGEDSSMDQKAQIYTDKMELLKNKVSEIQTQFDEVSAINPEDGDQADEILNKLTTLKEEYESTMLAIKEMQESFASEGLNSIQEVINAENELINKALEAANALLELNNTQNGYFYKNAVERAKLISMLVSVGTVSNKRDEESSGRKEARDKENQEILKASKKMEEEVRKTSLKTLKLTIKDREEARAKELADIQEDWAEAQQDYEEAVAEAQETYNEAVTDAEKTYNKALSDAETARNDAIKSATEAYDGAMSTLETSTKNYVTQANKMLEEVMNKIAQIESWLKQSGAGWDTILNNAGDTVRRTSDTVKDIYLNDLTTSAKNYRIEEIDRDSGYVVIAAYDDDGKAMDTYRYSLGEKGSGLSKDLKEGDSVNPGDILGSSDAYSIKKTNVNQKYSDSFSEKQKDILGFDRTPINITQTDWTKKYVQGNGYMSAPVFEIMVDGELKRVIAEKTLPEDLTTITKNNWKNYFKEFDGYASGSKSTPAGEAILGEEGQELILLPNGKVVVAGKDGIELANLPEGAQVIPADKTKEIFNKKKDYTQDSATTMPRFESGTENNSQFDSNIADTARDGLQDMTQEYDTAYKDILDLQQDFTKSQENNQKELNQKLQGFVNEQYNAEVQKNQKLIGQNQVYSSTIEGQTNSHYGRMRQAANSQSTAVMGIVKLTNDTNVSGTQVASQNMESFINNMKFTLPAVGSQEFINSIESAIQQTFSVVNAERDENGNVVASGAGAGAGDMVDISGQSGVNISGNDTVAQVYSYFKQRGWSDAGIAGVLGNFQVENGVRSNVVEGDYILDSSNALASPGHMSHYTVNKLFPAYANSGIGINKNAYRANDGNYYAGIGIGSWTGPAAKAYLDYANSKGVPWTDLNTQLDYFTNGLSPDAVERLKTSTSAEEATRIVFGEHEMPGYKGREYSHPFFAQRVTEAENFLNGGSMGSGSAQSKFTGSFVQLLTKIATEGIQSIISNQQPIEILNGEIIGVDGLMIPVDNYTVSSPFGPRNAPKSGASTNHKGVDLAAAGGTPIKASASGTVVYIFNDSTNGYGVKIDHGNGLTTAYVHMQSLPPVQVGQQITQGQIIGAVGSSGMSTGNHLHWQVTKNGVPVNPLAGRAKGGGLAKNETALVGELGREIILYPDGTAGLLGANGMEYADLPAGARIIPNDETEKILNNKVNYTKNRDPLNGYSNGTTDFDNLSREEKLKAWEMAEEVSKRFPQPVSETFKGKTGADQPFTVTDSDTTTKVQRYWEIRRPGQLSGGEKILKENLSQEEMIEYVLNGYHIVEAGEGSYNLSTPVPNKIEEVFNTDLRVSFGTNVFSAAGGQQLGDYAPPPTGAGWGMISSVTDTSGGDVTSQYTLDASSAKAVSAGFPRGEGWGALYGNAAWSSNILRENNAAILHWLQLPTADEYEDIDQYLKDIVEIIDAELEELESLGRTETRQYDELVAFKKSANTLLTQRAENKEESDYFASTLNDKWWIVQDSPMETYAEKEARLKMVNTTTHPTDGQVEVIDGVQYDPYQKFWMGLDKAFENYYLNRDIDALLRNLDPVFKELAKAANEEEDPLEKENLQNLYFENLGAYGIIIDEAKKKGVLTGEVLEDESFLGLSTVLDNWDPNLSKEESIELAKSLILHYGDDEAIYTGEFAEQEYQPLGITEIIAAIVEASGLAWDDLGVDERALNELPEEVKNGTVTAEEYYAELNESMKKLYRPEKEQPVTEKVFLDPTTGLGYKRDVTDATPVNGVTEITRGEYDSLANKDNLDFEKSVYEAFEELSKREIKIILYTDVDESGNPKGLKYVLVDGENYVPFEAYGLNPNQINLVIDSKTDSLAAYNAVEKMVEDKSWETVLKEYEKIASLEGKALLQLKPNSKNKAIASNYAFADKTNSKEYYESLYGYVGEYIEDPYLILKYIEENKLSIESIQDATDRLSRESFLWERMYSTSNGDDYSLNPNTTVFVHESSDGDISKKQIFFIDEEHSLESLGLLDDYYQGYLKKLGRDNVEQLFDRDIYTDKVLREAIELYENPERVILRYKHLQNNALATYWGGTEEINAYLDEKQSDWGYNEATIKGIQEYVVKQQNSDYFSKYYLSLKDVWDRYDLMTQEEKNSALLEKTIDLGSFNIENNVALQEKLLTVWEDYMSKVSSGEIQYDQKFALALQSWIDESSETIESSAQQINDAIVSDKTRMDDTSAFRDTILRLVGSNDKNSIDMKLVINAIKDLTQTMEVYPEDLDRILAKREAVITAITQATQNALSKYQELIEKQVKTLESQVSEKTSQKTLKQDYFEEINQYADTIHIINKELINSKLNAKWFEDSAREALFNEKDYLEISIKIRELEDEAKKDLLEYQKKINNLNEKNIYMANLLTEEYQERVELRKQELAILQAEIDLQKKQTALNTALMERNVRVFSGGRWRQIANVNDVIKAQEALADARYKVEQGITQKTQQEELNDISETIRNLNKQIGDLDSRLEQATEYEKEQVEKLSEITTAVKSMSLKDFKTIIQDLVDPGQSAAMRDSISELDEDMTKENYTRDLAYEAAKRYVENPTEQDRRLISATNSELWKFLDSSEYTDEEKYAKIEDWYYRRAAYENMEIAEEDGGNYDLNTEEGRNKLLSDYSGSTEDLITMVFAGLMNAKEQLTIDPKNENARKLYNNYSQILGTFGDSYKSIIELADKLNVSELDTLFRHLGIITEGYNAIINSDRADEIFKALQDGDEEYFKNATSKLLAYDNNGEVGLYDLEDYYWAVKTLSDQGQYFDIKGIKDLVSSTKGDTKAPKLRESFHDFDYGRTEFYYGIESLGIAKELYENAQTDEEKRQAQSLAIAARAGILKYGGEEGQKIVTESYFMNASEYKNRYSDFGAKEGSYLDLTNPINETQREILNLHRDVLIAKDTWEKAQEDFEKGEITKEEMEQIQKEAAAEGANKKNKLRELGIDIVDGSAQEYYNYYKNSFGGDSINTEYLDDTALIKQVYDAKVKWENAQNLFEAEEISEEEKNTLQSEASEAANSAREQLKSRGIQLQDLSAEEFYNTYLASTEEILKSSARNIFDETANIILQYGELVALAGEFLTGTQQAFAQNTNVEWSTFKLSIENWTNEMENQLKSLENISPSTQDNKPDVVIANPQSNAAGTRDSKAGLSLVNEKGVELLTTKYGQIVELNPHQKIFNNDQLNYLYEISKERLAGMSSTVAAITANNNNSLNIEELTIALDNVTDTNSFIEGLKGLNQYVRSTKTIQRTSSY